MLALVLHLVHQVVVRLGVPTLVAALLRRHVVQLAVVVHFFVRVLHGRGSHHADDRHVLVALTVVGQVVDGLALARRHLHLALPSLLHLGADAAHHQRAARQEEHHQEDARRHRRPGDLARRLRRVVGEKELAVTPSVARHAGAHVAVVSLMASSPVMAGVVLAATDGRGTVTAGVAWRTRTRVALWTFLARASILAGVGSAFVTAAVTVHASEALWTLAQVGVH